MYVRESGADDLSVLKPHDTFSYRNGETLHRGQAPVAFGCLRPNKVGYQLARCYSMAASLKQVNKTSLRSGARRGSSLTREPLKIHGFLRRRLPGIVSSVFASKCNDTQSYGNYAAVSACSSFVQWGFLCAAMLRSST